MLTRTTTRWVACSAAALCAVAGIVYAKTRPVAHAANATVSAPATPAKTNTAGSQKLVAMAMPSVKPVTAAPKVAEPAQPKPNPKGKIFQHGVASWYGPGFHNRLTANGERYNMNAMTAAHKTLPFGTVVVVQSATTGKTVTVRINDRGPFIKGRVIDLSRAAAKKLGMHKSGIQKVKLYRKPAKGKPKRKKRSSI